MPYHPESHHRRSIRLAGFDYSSAGAYFVTICAYQRQCLFGDVVDGGVVLNDCGRIVRDEWLRTPFLRPNVMLDEFIVMPNHFHAIIMIDTVGAHRCAPPVHAHQRAPIDHAHQRAPIDHAHQRAPIDQSPSHCWGARDNRAHIGAPLRRTSGCIGSIIAGFKSAATKRINTHRNTPDHPVWQRNYYEHVIRDDHDLANARQYINTNPAR